MQSFSEYTYKKVVVVLSMEEAHIMGIALQEYCDNNKRLQKAKKLNKEFYDKVEAY